MPLPQLKASIPHFVANGSIHFRLCGELTSLADSDGRVLHLLELLDGNHPTEQVRAQMQDRYPDLSAGDVGLAICDLDARGLLQDGGDPGADFTPDQLTRWSNNLGFFESYATLATSKYEFQRRIRDARVGVLGVGGIGSHVLIDLVAIGFTNIRIVDFDRIELSNFNRQILYGESCLGQRKIDVALQRATALNAAVHIDPIDLLLTSAEDVQAVVEDLDVVISVVDRPKMHVARWVNQGCVQAGTAFISGGVNVQQALHYTVVPGLSGCVECWRHQSWEQDDTSRMVQTVLAQIDQDGEAYGEDTAAFNALVAIDAGYMVSEMVRLVSRVTPPLSVGRLLGASFHNPCLREVESWNRQPGCPTCSTATMRDTFSWLPDQLGNLPF